MKCTAYAEQYVYQNQDINLNQCNDKVRNIWWTLQLWYTTTWL